MRGPGGNILEYLMIKILTRKGLETLSFARKVSSRTVSVLTLFSRNSESSINIPFPSLPDKVRCVRKPFHGPPPSLSIPSSHIQACQTFSTDSNIDHYIVNPRVL